MTFTHDIRVRYQEVDMQKVVFNAHYLAYCDETSAAWMAEVFGWTGADDAFDWMLVRAEIDWHRGATYGDTIRIGAEVARWGRTSFAIRYRGSVEGEAVFTAVITYVSVAPGTTDTMVVPDEVRTALGAAVVDDPV